jgi:hypothetical protein
MAAATAAVTSMPGVLVPELAARMLLMLIAGVVGAVDDKERIDCGNGAHSFYLLL